MTMAKKKTKTKAKIIKVDKKGKAELITTNDLPEGINPEAMEKITETVMGANQNLIDHFMKFVADKKLEKEFKAYCKKNPIVINIGDMMNELVGEDCDCPDCKSESKTKVKVKKVTPSYIG